jgi:5-methylcytosine-specific restriction enzyme subunit McrC
MNNTQSTVDDGSTRGSSIAERSIGDGRQSQFGRDPDVVLPEHSSVQLDDGLSDVAHDFLTDELGSSRLAVDYRREEPPILRSTQYVGVVSLPDGPTIEIQPKAAGKNLLSLLQYAQGLDATTYDRRTGLTEGDTFLDVLGALYATELDTVLTRGLHREYQSKNSTERYLRGRLDVQKQLQRQAVGATQFECEYDELTIDTTTNQAVLYATTVLSWFVEDTTVQNELSRYRQRLQRKVSLRHVRAAELDNIEVTRLNEHYADLLRLTRLILNSVFVENLRTGARDSFALLVDMNEVFEDVVERVVTDAVADNPGLSVETQASVSGVVSGGDPPITMRPDILVRDATDNVVLIADAKWKTPSKVSNDDVYQLVAYQSTYAVPGLLIFPEQDEELSTTYTVQDAGALSIVELPTERSTSHGGFGRQLVRSFLAEMKAVL